MKGVAALLLATGCSFQLASAIDDAQPSDGVRPDAVAADVRYRRSLTIESPPRSDLLSFPLAVLLDPTRIEYSVTAPGGADLRFTDAGGIPLAHEIETWMPGGVSVVWVNAPRISSTAATTLWLSYGDPNAADGQQRDAVWSSGFAAVLHLGEQVSDEAQTGVHLDSTGHGHDGLQRNNAITMVPGSLGGAQDFDGSGDYVEIPSGIDVAGPAITIEARARVRSEPTAWPHVLGGGADGRYWQLFWDPDGQGWANRFQIEGQKRENWTTAGAISTWVTLASVYDGVAVRLYVDGVEISSAPSTGSLDPLGTSLTIGANLYLIPRDFDGEIDEVRISTEARSLAWIEAHHRSVTDTLVVVGPRESL